MSRPKAGSQTDPCLWLRQLEGSGAVSFWVQEAAQAGGGLILLIARIRSQLKLPKIVKPHKDPKVLGKGLVSRAPSGPAASARLLHPSSFATALLPSPCRRWKPPSPFCLILLLVTSPD